MPTTRTVSPPSIGPWHAQVHAQLLLASDRETWIADAASARLGHAAQAAVAAARDAHPLDLAPSLEELVGDRDPHEALHELVSRFHRREGAVYGALVHRHGVEAEVVLRLAAWEHGIDTGRRLAAGTVPGPSGPSAVFDLIALNVLEGLPCQTTSLLVLEGPHRVAWKHDACPYRADWERVAVPLASACNVISAWIRGIAAGVDGNVEYRRPKAIAIGDERCEHEVVSIDL